LFERFSAGFTKKVSKVRKISYIQLNHRSPAIAVFHPSTRPRLMQADASFLNHVQAGPGRPQRRLSEWRPGLQAAKKPAGLKKDGAVPS
jgi:hypothetical protein